MGRSRPAWPLRLLAGLALLGAALAAAAEPRDFSLHPPYFNLAEGARIAASATCGEEAPARGAPRPTEDLYCKLVGGPAAGGDPIQTIQVSAGRWPGLCGGAGGAGGRGSEDPVLGRPGSGRAGGLALRDSGLTWPCESRPRERPGTHRSPRVPPRLSGFTSRRTERTPTQPFRLCQSPARPHATAPPGRPDAASPARTTGRGARGACAWSQAAASPGMRARRDLAAAPAACGEGRARSAFPQDELEPAAGARMGLGWGGRGQTAEALPAQREAIPAGGVGLGGALGWEQGAAARGRVSAPHTGPFGDAPWKVVSLQVGNSSVAPHTDTPREAGLWKQIPRTGPERERGSCEAPWPA